MSDHKQEAHSATLAPHETTAAPVADGQMLGAVASHLGAATLQRKLARRRLQRHAEGHDNGVGAGAEAAVARAEGSSGGALPSSLQNKFESSLGADLSGVRVHTGEASARAAESVSARAYTVGNDIHFGAGQFNPSSSGGQHLLAHEVAHTVQQSGGAARKAQFKLEVSSPGDGEEHKADRAADAMVSGQPAAVSGGAAGAQRATLQRQVTETAKTYKVLTATAELLDDKLKPVTPAASLAKDAPVTVLEAKTKTDILYAHITHAGGKNWITADKIGFKAGEVIKEITADHLTGRQINVTDDDAIIRGDDLKALKPKKTIPNPTAVTVQAEKNANGEDYVKVTNATGDITGWTSKGNLEGYKKYKQTDQAAWEGGKYAGQKDLLMVQGTTQTVTVDKETYPHFVSMASAASGDGIAVTINSGFRTYDEQSPLYEKYKKFLAGGAWAPKAAPPGSSNHQHGLAYDVSTGMPTGNPSGAVTAWTATYNWLVLRGWEFGFTRKVDSEAWHWEYRPGEANVSSSNYGTTKKLRDYMTAHPTWKPYPAYVPATTPATAAPAVGAGVTGAVGPAGPTGAGAPAQAPANTGGSGEEH